MTSAVDWGGKAGLALLMTLSVSAVLEALHLVRGHTADVIGIGVAAWEVWYGYGLRLIPIAVFLGCSTHIIGDMLTDSGCMLAFPLSRQRYHLLPEPLAFTTGTSPELLIVDPLLTAAPPWYSAAGPPTRPSSPRNGWESAELAAPFIDGSRPPAKDPRWAASGARPPEEYEYRAAKTCGMARLKMIMARRGLPIPATMDLVEQAIPWQAYMPQKDRVAGLIYQPFANSAADDYGIAAEVVPQLRLDQLTDLASPHTPVIASVHKWVRWPDRTPPSRGGHLVLVTGAADGLLRLHNPSGIAGVSQRDTLMQGGRLRPVLRPARPHHRASGRCDVPSIRCAAVQLAERAAQHGHPGLGLGGHCAIRARGPHGAIVERCIPLRRAARQN